jgi:stage III sporulation protein AG
MGNWFKKIEDFLGGGTGGSKRVRTFRWLLLIGLVGALLMILNSFVVKEVDPIGTGRASPPKETAAPALGTASGKDKTAFREYELAYETRLKEMLEKVVGVGDVDVMVTIDSTEEIVVEKNIKDTQQTTNEKDTNGATRHISDVTRSGEIVLYQVSGNQNPLVVKTVKPKIRGVFIAAKGAENITVKKLISEAVERGLDVPAFRISIVPRKQ